MAPEITESSLPFSHPSLPSPSSTYYKIIGSLSSPLTPLIILHGGPGLSHDYLLSLIALNERYGIPLVFYDQVGTGRSTHFRETRGDEGVWKEELFWRELEGLVKGLGLGGEGREWDLLGHSWGGMVGSTYAGWEGRGKGLRRLVLANAPASIKSWNAAYISYLSSMDEPARSILQKGEESGERETEEYQGALMQFLGKHACSVEFPPELMESFGWLKKDDTVSWTMMGPSEFETVGSLTDWDATEAAKRISVPTLLINGVSEGASDEAIRPFKEGIKSVKHVRFEKSTHLPFVEEKEKFVSVVGEWLVAGEV